MKLLFFLISILFTFEAYAFKIVVYTNESELVRTKKLVSELRTYEHLNLFEVEIDILQVNSNILGCRTDNATRVNCNTNNIIIDAATRKADHALIVHESDERIVGHGEVPVVSTSSADDALLRSYLKILGVDKNNKKDFINSLKARGARFKLPI